MGLRAGMQGRENIFYGCGVTVMAPSVVCCPSRFCLKAWLSEWLTSETGSAAVFSVPFAMVSSGRHNAVYCIPDSAMGMVPGSCALRETVPGSNSNKINYVGYCQHRRGASVVFGLSPGKRNAHSNRLCRGGAVALVPEKGNDVNDVYCGRMDLMAASETILKKEWQES